MTMAGSEGFLNLLPIYLDHILYPTLTVSVACVQEDNCVGDNRVSGVCLFPTVLYFSKT